MIGKIGSDPKTCDGNMLTNFGIDTGIIGRMRFKFLPQAVEDVVLVEPKILGDKRGLFFEVYRANEFHDAGIDTEFVQDNQSRSLRGTLRGLHFQIGDAAQAKLVRVAAGRIFDVAVDIRPTSSTYKQWVGAELSDENHCQLFVPEGFAHGFAVLSDYADVVYKTGPAYYTPEADRVIRWDDPDIDIEWPLLADRLISDRDASAPFLADVEAELKAHLP